MWSSPRIVYVFDTITQTNQICAYRECNNGNLSVMTIMTIDIGNDDHTIIITILNKSDICHEIGENKLIL